MAMQRTSDFKTQDDVKCKASTPPFLSTGATDEMSGAEDQVTKLKAENCQLQTRLFHIEHIVLAGKTAEIEQLLMQIGKEKQEKILIEQQRIQAVNHLQENMMMMDKENTFLKQTLELSQEEIKELETKRSGLVEEVQLLKNEMQDKAVKFDEEKRILEDKLITLRQEKRKFFETSNTVITLHKQLIETMNESPERGEDAKIGDAAHANSISVQHANNKGNCKQMPRMPAHSVKRRRLSSTSSSESPVIRIGVKFHSVDKTSIFVPSCICGMTFYSVRNLQNHVLCYGENIRPFACSICPKRYVTQGTLKLHQKRKHPEEISESQEPDGNDSETEMSSSEDE